MTLGEKIISLRSLHKLSQGDLAEKLDVSRQSVSKWETGASIPELDKLIMISDLFHVSLDELVKSESVTNDTPIETETVKTTYVVREKQSTPKQIIGYILLGAGLLGGILGIVLAIELLVVVGICAALYGIIFILSKKSTLLICGWFTLVLIFILSTVILAVGPIPFFWPLRTPVSIFTIVTYIFWALVIVLIIATVKTVISAVKTRRNKNGKEAD